MVGILDAHANQQMAAGLNANNDFYGQREDGTGKGPGHMGAIPVGDGSKATELSIGVEIDGKETLIPAVVPTISAKELKTLLDTKGQGLTKEMVHKAVDFAKQRMAEGKSPFRQWQEDQQHPLPDGFDAAAQQSRGLMNGAPQ